MNLVNLQGIIATLKSTVFLYTHNGTMNNLKKKLRKKFHLKEHPKE